MAITKIEKRPFVPAFPFQILAVLILIAGALMAAGSFPARAADENSKANALLVRSIGAWQEAMAIPESEQRGVARRAELLTGAAAGIRKIIEDYPGSDLAVRLITGERVGPFTAGELEAAAEKATWLHRPNRRCILAEARTSILEVENEGSRRWALFMHANSLAVAGFFNAAVDESASLTGEYMQEAIIEGIALEHVKKGKISEAIKMAFDSSELFTQMHVYAKIGEKHNDAKYMEMSIKAARLIKNNYSRFLAYTIIGKVDGYSEYLAHALEIAKSIDDFDLAINMKAEIAAEMKSEDVLDGAMKDVLNKKRRPKNNPADQHLSEIAVAYASIGNFGKARSILESIEPVKYRNSILKGIAVAHARTGDVKRAISVADGLGSEEARESAYFDVCIALLEGGHEDAAETVAMMMTRPPQKLIAMARVVGKTGNKPMMDLALEMARKIDSPYDRGSALSSIGAHYPVVGN